jgi:hypothetical protein
MSVPTAYLTSTKNTAAILDAIQRAAVPERFTFEFLKQLGYPSSGDRPMIPVLKAVGFLSESSVPTERYRLYKDKSQSKSVLAQGLREGYADVFAIDTDAHSKGGQDLSGIFARLSDKGESVTSKMATTFKALASLADFSSKPNRSDPVAAQEDIVAEPARELSSTPSGSVFTLRHDIHVHLPLSTDVAVYDAIFKSLKGNLL